MIYTGFAVMIYNVATIDGYMVFTRVVTYLHCCYACYNWLVDSFVEGSLNSKLPTIWRVEKQR